VATDLIDRFYKVLVNTLADLAWIHIRAAKSNQLKHWWDGEASTLKNNSRTTNKIWSSGSKPPNGVLFDYMISAKRTYKKHLKKLKNNSVGNITDSMHNDLLSKNNAHPCTIIFITRLLNLMMTHEYVPYDFRVSITIPIPKDPKVMVHNKSSDFRGISISPVISKVYEYCLLEKFKSYLRSSHLQFGFKNKTGCTKAIYSVQKTADYFTDG